MSAPLDEAKLTLVTDLAAVDEFRDWLGERRDWLAVDIETSGLNVGRDVIRLVQVGDTRRGWAFPYVDWKGPLKELLPQYRGEMVCHNAIFDSKFLKRDGIVLPQRYMNDTMVMAHLVDPRGAIGLKSAATRYVDPRAQMGQHLLSEAFHGGGWTWGTIPTDHPSYWIYSTMDTVLTAGLAEKLWPQVQPYRNIYDIELACIHVLRDAALRGVRIDLERTRATWHALETELQELRPQIPCDPTDAKVRAMFRDLCKPQSLEDAIPFKTKSGAVSVNDDALAYIEPRWPHIVRPLRRYRKRIHLKRNYIENMLAMQVDGVVYPSVKPLGARTARMSVTEPALQTLPRGKTVRDCYIPSEGSKMLLADYKQIEARVMASYAGEQTMIDAFLRGEDLHQWTAAQVYGKAQEEVAKIERQISKNTGYAKIYGAGDEKIAVTAGVPLGAIQQFQARYDELFPRIGRFMAEVVQQVVKRAHEEGDGYIITRLGRRLPVDKAKAYTGINYLIQSSATADVLKLKLVELDAAGLGRYIRLPVHDEVMFDVPEDELDVVTAEVARVMPERKLFTCPLEIDMEVVDRWGDSYEDE